MLPPPFSFQVLLVPFKKSYPLVPHFFLSYSVRSSMLTAYPYILEDLVQSIPAIEGSFTTRFRINVKESPSNRWGFFFLPS